MGLYDTRLAALSESRRGSRVAPSRSTFTRSAFARTTEAARKPAANVQTLLFSVNAGWTAAKAKEWAKAHGYKHGKTHATDQYIRIRQFDPKGLKVKKTITLGRGIRAVVAREEDMAAKRRRRTSTSKKAASRPRRRAHKARETTVAAPARRRRRAPSSLVMEAKRPRRRRAKRRTVVRAWKGAKKAHARAAKKGWAKRKRRSTAKRSAPRRRRRVAREASVVMSPRRRSRRRRHAAAAPRRHRRRKARFAYEVSEAKRPRRSRRRRSHRMFASRSSGSMSTGQLVVAVLSSGFGFVAADGLDRFLATYNPAKPAPTDKFTSQGVGTLANTLNVASRPGAARIGAAIGAVAVPALASRYIRSSTARASVEGMAFGAGISAFRLLWNNVLMPLLKPKDAVSLQKSPIARLYPAEVSAAINMVAAQTAVPAGTAFGALSGQPGMVGDVGPFALATGGDSQFPDAAQALRRQAGLQGFPSLQNTWGTGMPTPGMPGVGQFPTAAQALNGNVGAGPAPIATDVTSYMPGPPPLPGPGPQANPHESCGCIGDKPNAYLGFIGDAEDTTSLTSLSLR